MSVTYVYLFGRVMATICCIFGLPGNVLTIIVCIKALCQRTINFERKVFDLYLAEISILDTCLLLYWVAEIFFRYLYNDEHFSLLHTSVFSCFFLFMLNRLFAALCSWLITCFTFIRFLNIFRRLNTIRSNIILVICLTIIVSIANSYLLDTLKYDRGEIPQEEHDNSSSDIKQYLHNSSKCYVRHEYRNSKLRLFFNTFIAGFLNLALPSVLTLIVNITIVCYIKRIYKSQEHELTQRRSDGSGANYRSTRSTLLAISITYTLCYLPYCTLNLLLIILGDRANPSLYYWSNILFTIRYISHSINFYAYIFTNQRFRRDIIVLLRNIYRPYIYIKERNEKRKKSKHRVKTPSATLNNTVGRPMINYQRPTCIRFQNPNHLDRQQNTKIAENYQTKPKTILASKESSSSFDTLVMKARV